MKKQQKQEQTHNLGTWILAILIGLLFVVALIVENDMYKKKYTEEGIKIAQANCINLICQENAGACPTKLNDINIYCGSLVRDVDMRQLQ